ncbi:universal stress protein [Dissulfurispira thermophila]|uniref:Universal stress protein n=2 Tax=root TaxID=1 RepID=A0A7G1H0Z0_9BACT|nr:universal stress protein [Dissulfurispira thermophila]BCB95706.1 universal stress protein [Dissulfurispira thermophila]
MYNNILVAFDGSEFSKAALIESSNWIKRHGGKLIIVHAVYFDEEEFGIAPEQREKRFELGKNICYQTKETILSEFAIDVDSIVCEGEPPDIIVDIAREKKTDLIAMGTYGRKGLKRLVMGSVTSKVIVNSPCDILVVKKPCSECTGEYKSILVPFDGSEFSKKALGHACRMSKLDNAEITVLYVIPRYEEMVEFFRTESIKKSLMREAERIIAEAKKIASSASASISTTIQEGSAGDSIIDIAGTLKNDLIVMGTYGWKGVSRAIMGSTTERVIMNASCPVLVVR